MDTKEDMLGYTKLANMEKRMETKIQVLEDEKATTTHWAEGQEEVKEGGKEDEKMKNEEGEGGGRKGEREGR